MYSFGVGNPGGGSTHSCVVGWAGWVLPLRLRARRDECGAAPRGRTRFDSISVVSETMGRGAPPRPAHGTHAQQRRLDAPSACVAVIAATASSVRRVSASPMPVELWNGGVWRGDVFASPWRVLTPFPVVQFHSRSCLGGDVRALFCFFKNQNTLGMLFLSCPRFFPLPPVRAHRIPSADPVFFLHFCFPLEFLWLLRPVSSRPAGADVDVLRPLRVLAAPVLRLPID